MRKLLKTALETKHSTKLLVNVMPYLVAARSDISYPSSQQVLTKISTDIPSPSPANQGRCTWKALYWTDSYLMEEQLYRGSLQIIYSTLVPVEPCEQPTFFFFFSLLILLFDNSMHVYKVLELLTAPYLLSISIEHHPPFPSAPFPGSWIWGWCCNLCGLTRAISVATRLEPCSGAWRGHQWECNYRQWFSPLPKSISIKYLSSEGQSPLSPSPAMLNLCWPSAPDVSYIFRESLQWPYLVRREHFTAPSPMVRLLDSFLPFFHDVPIASEGLIWILFES